MIYHPRLGGPGSKLLQKAVPQWGQLGRVNCNHVFVWLQAFLSFPLRGHAAVYSCLEDMKKSILMLWIFCLLPRRHEKVHTHAVDFFSAA